MFQINKGIIIKPLRVVVYGTEGIGKSTFASQFPSPVFIDTEGSTNYLDVARFPAPTSWEMLMQEVDQVIKDPSGFKTLVIDTADWAQNLCVQFICAKKQVSGIEDFGYGQGYTYVKEEFGKLLNRLNDVIDKGLNVVMTAHSIINKFTKPDEMGQFDRYELKLINSPKCSIAALVKEWSDLLLFANYETFLIEDSKTKKKYASGNRRVMYTTHTAAFDAKNRFGMPDKLEFKFDEIKLLFQNDTKAVPASKEQNVIQITAAEQPAKQIYTQQELDVMSRIPKELRDLMIANEVHPQELADVVGSVKVGYFPSSMSIDQYDPAFYLGFLVPEWSKIMQEITFNRNLPF